MSDLIDRQDAIYALRTHERKASKKWFDNQLDIEWNNAIDICCYDIEDLPSAQPEVAKDTNVLINDCISRQAAIDALDKRFDSIPMNQTTEILLLRKDLRELPSAQPKRMPGKWIDDGDPFMWVCDVCGYRVKRYNNTRYCPHCGAKMEVDDGSD